MWSVKFKNHQIDLIVLDIMMPGEDGLTLCRQLRANPQQDIPVLMLRRPPPMTAAVPDPRPPGKWG